VKKENSLNFFEEIDFSEKNEEVTIFEEANADIITSNDDRVILYGDQTDKEENCADNNISDDDDNNSLVDLLKNSDDESVDDIERSLTVS